MGSEVSGSNKEKNMSPPQKMYMSTLKDDRDISKLSSLPFHRIKHIEPECKLIVFGYNRRSQQLLPTGVHIPDIVKVIILLYYWNDAIKLRRWMERESCWIPELFELLVDKNVKNSTKLAAMNEEILQQIIKTVRLQLKGRSEEKLLEFERQCKRVSKYK